jgi:uncharacterized protein (TIGR00299 family) protein
MNTICYLDCFSGISGNMLLGALLAAGLPESVLRTELDKLKLKGWRLEMKPTSKTGLQATLVKVHTNRDEVQHPRHLSDIRTMLEQSALNSHVILRSLAVFQRLAEGEAAVHGISIEEVHFHEVGALDALIDIVGVMIGFAYFGIKEVICSPLPMPRGWVRCQHGELPLPVPAVCELLKGIPVYGENLAQELVTPTGAALAVELSDSFGMLPTMRIERTGYGAGSRVRRDRRPNLLRLLLGQRQCVEESQLVEVLETQLDDWNPESWPYVSTKLLAANALDVNLIPIQMKKGRPGFLLRVIAAPAHSMRLKDILVQETSAIGLRFHTVQRMTLARKTVELTTPWGTVRGKQVELPDGRRRIKPEYEDCVRLAKEHNLSLEQVRAAAAECHHG